MSTKINKEKSSRYPVWAREILPIETATDIHPHTSFTDGKLLLMESLDEAKENNLYEKGAIDHGNPIDEDIDHPTTFLNNYKNGGDEPYTSSDIYPVKFELMKEFLSDSSGTTTLTDADPEKLREDFQTINRLKNSTSYPRESKPETSTADLLEYGMNYTMLGPHGIEIDYNPAIEAAKEEKEQEAIESYEKAIINFLKQAESLNSGYNYILGSSHYVNTPFKPRYVKVNSLFEELRYEEKIEALENYREKELSKIESLAPKLEDMAIPEISEELMNREEIEQLEDFIYDQTAAIDSIIDEDIEKDKLLEINGEEIGVARPGVFVVGAHPTLIERNEELMDVFRQREGIKTKEEITAELNEFMYDITGSIEELPGDAETVSLHQERLDKQDLEKFLNYKEEEHFYPSEALEKYYEPMIAASREEDNFIFEINGKAVSRQHPSIFWNMLDEHVFGSDSHRLGEQPDRSQEYYEKRLGGETVFLSEKWLSQLEAKNNNS